MNTGQYVLVRGDKIITEPFETHIDATDHAKKVIGAQALSEPIYVLKIEGKIYRECVVVEEKI